jgi:hypothetical protein
VTPWGASANGGARGLFARVSLHGGVLASHQVIISVWTPLEGGGVVTDTVMTGDPALEKV